MYRRLVTSVRSLPCSLFIDVIEFLIDTSTITTLRQISPQASTLPIYVQDAFDLQQFSDFVAARTDFVVEDHHSYFVFSQPEDTNYAAQDTAEVQTSIYSQLATASNAQRGNIIVGEWSCALTPMSLANSTDQLTVRQLFCEGQQQTYANTTAGWSFWSTYLDQDYLLLIQLISFRQVIT